MTVQPDLVVWTHDALEHVFDLAFLRTHLRAECVRGIFENEQAAQNELLQIIKRLRPPLMVSVKSPAWRTYNILNLRYVQGLTQNEVAERLHISSRYLRHEQREALQAVATLLFDQPNAPEQPARDESATIQHADDLSSQNSEPLRLDEVLRAVLGVLDPLFQARHLTLNIELPVVPPVVRANRVMLRQLLMSAFSWLVRDIAHCAASVRVDTLGDRLLLRLTKPGAAHVVKDDVATGGLGAVQQIADALSAQVRTLMLEDNSSIEIDLPALQTSCVLVIDDDPRSIELVRRFLEWDARFHVVAATQPEDALWKAATLRPACILLDVMMPAHDGWEMLTLLKVTTDTAAIPVIVSSVLKEQDLPRALGAADVLRKPFGAEQLKVALESAIARARQSQAPSHA